MTTIRMFGRTVLYAFVAVQIAATVGFAAFAAVKGGTPIDVPGVERTHKHWSII